MKIKLNRPLRGDEGTHRRGTVVERPEAAARSLIQRGLATEVDETALADEAGAAAEPPPRKPRKPRGPKPPAKAKPAAAKSKRQPTRKGAKAPEGD